MTPSGVKYIIPQMSSYKVRQERKALLRKLRLNRRVKRQHKRSYDYELAKLSAENNMIRREAAADVFEMKREHCVRWERPMSFAPTNAPVTTTKDGRLRMLCNTLRIDQRSICHRPSDYREWMMRKVADDLAKVLVRDGLLTVEWPSEDAMRRAEYGNERFLDLGNLSIRWAFYVAPVPMRDLQKV